jgi:homoserine kinase type II
LLAELGIMLKTGPTGAPGLMCATMENELRRVLDRYNLGKLMTVQQIERGFVNENWVVETDQGRYFLKRRHPHLRNPNVIRAQHALIEHLCQADFPTPAVIPTASGETLLTLDTEFYEVHEYVEGTPYDHTSSEHFQEAARMLGQYHTHVRGCAPQALCDLGELYSPAILRANLAHLTNVWALEHDTDLVQMVRQLQAHAVNLETCFSEHGSLPHLVIHGDYYAGNLLFEGDRIVGVVDYDKARWQPRVVELAEALIYFASPRPGRLKHLVYPGFLEWEPFTRFLRHYAHVIALEENEARALPDYVGCIWLSVSLQGLLEKCSRPTKALDALREVLSLGDWARDNTQRMIETAHTVK